MAAYDVRRRALSTLQKYLDGWRGGGHVKALEGYVGLNTPADQLHPGTGLWPRRDSRQLAPALPQS